MSEFSDKTSVNKLIGSSAWYVWYEEGWMLTEKVKEKNLILLYYLMKIEKWDFEVYNLLLQILEEWVLTDNKWKSKFQKYNYNNDFKYLTRRIFRKSI